jgi:hypothetical protein
MRPDPHPPRSGVRYRDDTGLELRCQACKSYWPLTREFWDFRAFRRCRACVQQAKNKATREWLARNPEARRKLREYQRRYRQDAHEVKAMKAYDRYWSDPEKARAKAREYYLANREAVLARKRARHAARKAA